MFFKMFAKYIELRNKLVQFFSDLKKILYLKKINLQLIKYFIIIDNFLPLIRQFFKFSFSLTAVLNRRSYSV